MVVNAAGFCISSWSDNGKCGIVVNCVPVLMDGGYE